MLFFCFLFRFTDSCDVYSPGNPNFYCDNVVYWNVSDDVQKNAWNLSKQAYSYYYELKEKYLANMNSGGNDTTAPTLECLAVAQEFYCAAMFPFCRIDPNTGENIETGLCTNLCRIWQGRCPNEDSDFFCSKNFSSFCSFSWLFGLSLSVMILI